MDEKLELVIKALWKIYHVSTPKETTNYIAAVTLDELEEAGINVNLYDT